MLKGNDKIWLYETLDKVTEKMSYVRERSAEKLPAMAIDGVHDNRRIGDYPVDNGINWWTNGFFAGMLWQMYKLTGDKVYKFTAEKTEIWLDKAFDMFVGLHHDVGFMWLPSSVANFRLTGNEKSRVRGLHAANLLAGRFNLNGRFIRAWNDLPGKNDDTRGWVIIDCMLNIPLLYWASHVTGDPRYRQMAMAHADKTMKYFIRPDGSVEHIVEFNPDTGALVTTHRGQGYEKGSSWTRGQSWALYGFWMSFRQTGKKEYLDAAEKVAEYFMANIPDDGLIPVDFRQPQTPFLEDDTAAAVAACGLIEISRSVSKKNNNVYLDSALKMLKKLDVKRCDYRQETDTFLTHCSSAYYDKNHHYPLVYADYFYMEALLKLKGCDLFIW